MSAKEIQKRVTSERDLDPFYTLCPDLLCIASLDGFFKHLSPAWEKTLGFSIEELLQKRFIEFVHPDDRERTVHEVQKLAQGAETMFFDNRYRCRDGSYKWLSWTAIARIERQQIYAIARDVTELKSAQDALREAYAQVEARIQERTAELERTNEALTEEIEKRKAIEESLRQANQTIQSIVAASPQAIIALDTGLKVHLWNPAAEGIFGWTASEVIGSPVPFVPEDKRDEYRELSERALAGVVNQEIRRFRRDGTAVDLLLSTAPLRDERDHVRGYVAVIADFTDKRELENRLLRAQRMESLGTLAGGVAHDLNNVLAPILMGIQLLRMNYPDELGLLATLETSAKRGGDLVKQVLTFARGVQGERVTLQLKHLIVEVERMVRQTFPKTIDIVIEISKDLWIVKADSTQLHQVLMNLCVNARDAMPNGGTLTLTARNFVVDDSYSSMNPESKAGAYVVVDVSDTGVGIQADTIDKIFDPFFTTKGPGERTGLGLSTALAIVKAHGGFLNVYSEPGNGSQFTVYLPAALDAETLQMMESGDVPLGQGELILVVDDEAAVRDIARATLEAHDYRALTATDGAEAVALYVQHRNEISIVLSDSSMPVMDGAALAKALQSFDPTVKIVSMSGLRQNGKTALAPEVSAAFDAFLPKPFTAEQLIRTLHEVVSRPRERGSI